MNTKTCRARSSSETCALPAGHHGEFHVDADEYAWCLPYRPGHRVQTRGGEYPGTVLYTSEAADGALMTRWVTDSGQTFCATPLILVSLENH